MFQSTKHGGVILKAHEHSECPMNEMSRQCLNLCPRHAHLKQQVLIYFEAYSVAVTDSLTLSVTVSGCSYPPQVACNMAKYTGFRDISVGPVFEGRDSHRTQFVRGIGGETPR